MDIQLKGLYAIDNDELNRLYNLDREVLLDCQRLYLVVEKLTTEETKDPKQYYAIPFRTNISKHHPPYIALRKMSGASLTQSGKTHGLHIAKVIPVRRKHLLKSRHAKNYKPLMEDGTFNSILPSIKEWLEIFEDDSISPQYKPAVWATSLKLLI